MNFETVRSNAAQHKKIAVGPDVSRRGVSGERNCQRSSSQRHGAAKNHAFTRAAQWRQQSTHGARSANRSATTVPTSCLAAAVAERILQVPLPGRGNDLTKTALRLPTQLSSCLLGIRDGYQIVDSDAAAILEELLQGQGMAISHILDVDTILVATLLRAQHALRLHTANSA